MKRFIFFFFLSFGAAAQLREVAEASIMLPDGVREDLEVIAVHDDIVLVNFQDDYVKREQRLMVMKYNGSLELTWTGSVTVPRFYVPVSYVVDGTVLYYLLKEPQGRKLHMVQFDLENETTGGTDFESITLLENTGFHIFNGQPLISGTYNQRPVVEMHDLTDKTARVLPDIYTKNNELKGIFVNPYRNELYVFSAPGGSCQIQAATYDENGKLLFRHAIGDKKHRVQQVDVRTGPSGEPFVAGTYNSVCLDMMEGFFAGSLDLPQEIRYHSIATLPGYNASLSEKKKRRLQLRKDRGKSGEIRQKAIFHVPVSGASGFLLAADLYSAQSVTGTRTVEFTDVSGKKNDYSEFKVWRVLLAESDAEGNMISDGLFKLEGSNFRGLFPQSAFLVKNEKFYAFLPAGNKLVYTGAGQQESHVLFSSEEGLRVTDADIQLLNLNSSSLIAHGVAEIKPAAADGNSRQIYFIKKLELP